MCIFAKQKIDLIKSKKTFYKLFVDGKCQFDEYCKEIEPDKRLSRTLIGAYALMDSFGDGCMLPSTKFNHIQGIGRNDVFEFKKDVLRIYIIKQEPDVCIILGGFKQNQKKDISKIKKLIKELPHIIEIRNTETK